MNGREFAQLVELFGGSRPAVGIRWRKGLDIFFQRLRRDWFVPLHPQKTAPGTNAAFLTKLGFVAAGAKPVAIRAHAFHARAIFREKFKRWRIPAKTAHSRGVGNPRWGIVIRATVFCPGHQDFCS
jgi:hypothetical protein